MDQLRTSSGSIIRGVWAPPKLLAEAKSDENERTKAESWGSNTPWAYRPGEFLFVFVLALGGPELLLGSLAGPQGMLEGFLGSLGGPRKFLGGPG